MTTKGFKVDADDPRAPPADVWEAMTEAERAKVIASLPSEIPRAHPPEGDRHFLPKIKAREALGEYFRRIGRGVYLGSELPVYYPGERVFAPDLIAVLDVDPHPRERWAVSQEKRGVDLALEITLHGDPKKDLERNVVLFARLGIPEYFVLDARTSRLIGYRLAPGDSTYTPIVPQGGRWTSKVLGLDLSLEAGRVRFFHGSAALPEASELIVRLEGMMDDLTTRVETTDRAREEADRAREEADRAREEADRAREEADRAREEAEARAERLAQRLRELGVDPDDT